MEEQINQNNQPNQPNQPSPAPQAANASDADKNKPMAIIGYIIPILFFIPLITEAKNSPFAKFHANQQLMILIAAIIVNIVGGVIPFIGWFIIFPFGNLFLIILAIMGIINSAKGEMKKLPIIGGFQIIK
jgi:uncharacterized membrane protein